ncbi:MAG: DNA-binding transcriptional regulator [Bacteroides sp.]|nr:DNA-binding transcriptional regulator [Bacteroides sp.]
MPPSYKHIHGIPGVLEWARKWEADAIIGQFDTNDEVGLFAENGIVALAQDYKKRWGCIPNITGAYHLTGEMAAGYFMQKGFRQFAFYGYRDVVWSQERCEGFQAAITRQGYAGNFYEYQHQQLDELWFYEADPLCAWLLSLPHPIALMACDDNQASRITEACKLCGLRIPEDIAVLGVDNDEVTCTLSDPTLSSVDMNIKRGGYEAARLLETLLKDPEHPYQDVIIQPTGIVSRQSTNTYSTEDPYILKALQYIHQHVGQGIHVEDVVQQVPLSRRLLEIRFKQETCKSVYQYIFHLRMERFTQLLLRSNDPIAEIAQQTGFSDLRNLARQFRLYKGCTPLEYRRKHR